VIKALWKLTLRLLPALLAVVGMWWRIQQPVESYAALIELSEFVTGTAMTALGAVSGWDLSARMLQNAINLVLVDQFNGVVVGIIVSTIFSLLWWLLTSPFRAIGSLFKRNKKPSA